MKYLRDKKGRFASKTKIIIPILIGFMITIIGFIAFRSVIVWFDNNKITYNPLDVRVSLPNIKIEKREPEIIRAVVDYPDTIDTPVEQYICEKWGLMDCKVALAVAKSESGMNCHAFNANDNGTIDVGIFQINSIHYDDDFTIADATDCYKNIDKAHEIYQEQGWSPWVVFWNGSFKENL